MGGSGSGRPGGVLSVDPFKNTVTVEHAGVIKRHTRPNPSKNIKGGIIEREGAIHISNVLLVCPSCRKHTRVRHARLSRATAARSCCRSDPPTAQNRDA